MVALAVLAFALASMALAGHADGNVYVSKSGSDATGDGTAGNPYLTIQTGIDHASPTDTVIVGTGFYTSTGGIVIDKALTLTSEAGTSTIIAPIDGHGVEITASGVTVIGLAIAPSNDSGIPSDAMGIRIEAPATTTGITITDNVITTVGSTNHCIFVSGSQAGDAPSIDLTVTGNTITCGSVGIGVSVIASTPKHSGWEVSGNVFEAHGGANLQITDVDNLTISSNVLGAATGVSVVIKSDLSDLIGPIVFANNDVEGASSTNMVSFESGGGTMDGVAVERNSFSNWTTNALRIGSSVTSVRVSENGFGTGNTKLANESGQLVDGSGNWWDSGVEGVLVSDIGGGNVDYSPWLDVGTDTEPGTVGFQGDFSTLHVSADSPQSGPTGHIQEAALLVSGSTINVLPGDYISADPIVIEATGLTLRSTGGAGSSSTPVTLIERVCCGSPVIELLGSDGFTLGGAPDEGFVVRAEASTTVSTLLRSDNGADNVTVSHNIFDTRAATFTDNTAIFVSGDPASNIAIADNEFIINSDAGSGSQTAISLFDVEDLQITNNTVQGDATALASTTGAAIRLFNASKSTLGTAAVSSNTIDRLGIAIELTSATDVTVSGNGITEVGVGVFVGAALSNNVIDGNAIQNSGAFGQGHAAVLLEFTSDETVSNNSIENFAYGVKGAYVFDTSVTGNTVLESMTAFSFEGTGPTPFVNLTIQNNTSTNAVATTSTTGIYLYYDYCCSQSTGHDVSGNTVENFEYGIQTYNVSNSVVDGNTVTESMEGIVVESGDGNVFSQVRVTNNVVVNASSTDETTGIYLDNTYCCGQSTDNAVSGNTVTNFEYGITAYNVSRSQIDGNEVSEAMDGISVASGGSNAFFEVSVTGNVVTSTVATTTSTGIYLAGLSPDEFDRARDNSVSSNQVHNYASGIGLLFVKDTTATDNVLTGVFNGVYGGWGQFGRNDISDNSITDPLGLAGPIVLEGPGLTLASTTGVWLFGEDEDTIFGNTIADFHTGILLEDAASDNSIGGTLDDGRVMRRDPNTITGAQIGIYLKSDSDSNEIVGHSLVGPGSDSIGIFLDYSDTNELWENSATGFGTGVRLGTMGTAGDSYENDLVRMDLSGNGTGVAIYSASYNTVNESFIRNNTGDGAVVDDSSYNTEINRSHLSGNGGYAVNNLGPKLTGASGNWWNVTGQSEVPLQTNNFVTSSVATGGSESTLDDGTADFLAESIRIGHILINDTDGSHAEITDVVNPTTLAFVALFGGVDNMVEAGDAYHIESVDYTPWLLSGTDTEPGIAGFQGDFSALHVDARSPQMGEGGRVQEAASLIDGSTILVYPGFYAYENIYVNDEDVTITSTDGPSVTILDGAGSSVFDISIDGREADDFSFDVVIGDAQVIASGTATGGTVTTTVDTAVDFYSLGVRAGDVIKNETDGSYATVTGVATTTNPGDTLVFDDGLSYGYDDVFEAGDDYRVEQSQGFTIQNGGYGISAEHILYDSTLTVLGNLIAGNNSTGIHVGYDTIEKDSHLTVEWNRVVGNGGNGVEVERILDHSSATISHNLIASNECCGVSLSKVSLNSSVSVEDNTVSENGCSGVYHGGGYVEHESSVTVVDNQIAGNDGDGLYLEAVRYLSTASIRDNLVFGNDGDGVEVYKLDEGSTASTTNNILSGNDSHGLRLYMVEEGSSAFVYGNVAGEYRDAGFDLEGNGGSGIYVGEVSDSAELTIGGPGDLGNQVSGNGDDGTYLSGEEGGVFYGSTVTVQNNVVGGWLYNTSIMGTHDGLDYETQMLFDSSVDFQALGVRYKDVVYNLTDGSWAMVDDVETSTIYFDEALMGGTLEPDGPSGTDDSSFDSTYMLTDTDADFVAAGVLEGHTIQNTTDGSTGVITEVDPTVLYFDDGLTGGTLEADGPTGTHTGDNNQVLALYDGDVHFEDVGVRPGHIVENLTDGSSAIITDIYDYDLKFAAGLSGGVDNDFDEGDAYRILWGDFDAGDSYQVLWGDFDRGDTYLIAFHLEGNGEDGIYVYWVDHGSSVFIGGPGADEGNIITENEDDGIFFEMIGFDPEYDDTEDYYEDFQDYGANTVVIENNVSGAYEYAEGAVTHRLGGRQNDGIEIDYIDFASVVSILDNSLTENRNEGLDLDEIGRNGEDFVVCDEYGCRLDERFPLYTGPDVTVQGNDMTGNGDNGLELSSVEYFSTVVIGAAGASEANNISGNDDSGISHRGDIAYNSIVTIWGNTINDNGQDGEEEEDERMGVSSYYEGISIRDGAAYTLQDNVITGNGDDGVYFYDVTGRDTVVTITGNDMSGNGVAADVTGDGLRFNMIDEGATVHVTDNNTLSGNDDDGMSVSYLCDDADADLLVSDNDIENNSDNGVKIEYTDCSRRADVVIGPGNRIRGNDTGVDLHYEVEYVRVVGNDIEDNAHGVWIEGDDNMVGHNNIVDNVGVSPEDESGVHLTYEAERNVLRYNNIVGNSPYGGSFGVFQESGEGEIVDARANWWGAADGPSMFGPGSGDTVNSYVDYSEWLTGPAPVPDVTPPSVYAEATPGTLSWNYVLSVDGPDGGFDHEALRFEAGPWEGWVVASSTDDGYYEGITKVRVDLKTLLLDILEPVELDAAFDAFDAEDWERWDDDLYDLQRTYLDDDGEFGPETWTHRLDLVDDLWVNVLANFSDNDTIQLIAQDLARGDFTVEVTAMDWSGNEATTTMDISLVDMQMPLETGWNARSTPISLEGGKWMGGDWLADPEKVDAVLRYDPDLGFVLLTGEDVTDLEPLEAVYIHMKSNEEMGLIWDGAAPQHSVGEGWNLIGPAMYSRSLPVSEALKSIEQAAGDVTGFSSVSSIAQDVDYTQESYEGDYTYDWDFTQDSWLAYPGGGDVMEIGGAYWVFMENDDMLGGFGVPPIIYNYYE